MLRDASGKMWAPGSIFDKCNHCEASLTSERRACVNTALTLLSAALSHSSKWGKKLYIALAKSPRKMFGLKHRRTFSSNLILSFTLYAILLLIYLYEV